MKTTTRLQVLVIVGMTCTALLSRAQPGLAHEPADNAPPPPHARFGQVVTDLLDKYDVNHDGQLDQSEMAALRKDATEGKLQPPGPPPGRGPGGTARPQGQRPPEHQDRNDLDQGGRQPPPRADRGVAPQGAPRMGPPPSAQQVLSRFDADHDGKLDEAELRQFLRSMPAPRPPHGPNAPTPPGPPPGDLPPPQ
jgi:hypothetical protein